MYTVQHPKHKRGRVQTGTFLYTVPIFVLIGQYNNQDSPIYTKTPGYIPGLLDTYQDSWMSIRTPGCLSGLLDVQHPELPNHA